MYKRTVKRSEFESLAREVKENTELTKDIHAIVRSFRILGMISKWIAALAAGATAIWHGIEWLRLR